jgi:hypothetical protein
MAEEPVPSLDLGALPKSIAQDIHQSERDRSQGRNEEATASSDPIKFSKKSAFDTPSAKQRWDEPTKPEEIPYESAEAGGQKEYVITTPLPFQICVIEKSDAGPQRRFACKNTKF